MVKAVEPFKGRGYFFSFLSYFVKAEKFELCNCTFYDCFVSFDEDFVMVSKSIYLVFWFGHFHKHFLLLVISNCKSSLIIADFVRLFCISKCTIKFKFSALC